MPSRSLPRTDDDRSAALNGCISKYNGTAAEAARLITAAQFAALTGRAGTWNSARGALGPLLYAQSSATTLAGLTSDALEQVVSHFIQVFNMAVDREVFAPADRAFYQLEVGNNRVPSLKSAADLELWSQRIVDGEAARVAAGGARMAMPGAAEVAAALAAYSTASEAQSRAKSAFDAGQAAVASQRPDADLLIKDLWDTIEFNLRALDAPSLRRAAREWGIDYSGDEAPPAEPAPEPAEPTPPTAPQP